MPLAPARAVSAGEMGGGGDGRLGLRTQYGSGAAATTEAVGADVESDGRRGPVPAPRRRAATRAQSHAPSPSPEGPEDKGRDRRRLHRPGLLLQRTMVSTTTASGKEDLLRVEPADPLSPAVPVADRDRVARTPGRRSRPHSHVEGATRAPGSPRRPSTKRHLVRVARRSSSSLVTGWSRTLRDLLEQFSSRPWPGRCRAFTRASTTNSEPRTRDSCSGRHLLRDLLIVDERRAQAAGLALAREDAAENGSSLASPGGK